MIKSDCLNLRPRYELGHGGAVPAGEDGGGGPAALHRQAGHRGLVRPPGKHRGSGSGPQGDLATSQDSVKGIHLFRILVRMIRNKIEVSEIRQIYRNSHLAVIVSEYEGGPVLRPGEAGDRRARLLPHQLRPLRPAGLQRPEVGLPAVISAQFHVSVGQARLGRHLRRPWCGDQCGICLSEVIKLFC